MRTLLILLALTLPACGILRDPCAATAAQRASGAVLAQDAQERLDEATAVILTSLGGDLRAEALAKLDAAYGALDAARKALAAINDVCDDVALASVFRSFREAWLAIEPYLALLAGSKPTLRVARPMVIEL